MGKLGCIEVDWKSQLNWLLHHRYQDSCRHEIRFQCPTEDSYDSFCFMNLLVFMTSKKINPSEGNTRFCVSEFITCYSQVCMMYNELFTCILLEENYVRVAQGTRPL
jgi:hypothetical protein